MIEEMKILVADDELRIRQFYCNAAHISGFPEVETVSSGEEALTCVIRNRYDLIVLDITMPEAGGLEIISMVRNLSHHAVIAIISGRIPATIPSEATDCADAIIEKPIAIKTFRHLLESADQVRRILEDVRRINRRLFDQAEES